MAEAHAQLDRLWFETFSFPGVDPQEAFDEWQAVCGPAGQPLGGSTASPESHRRILELASGLGKGTIGNYLNAKLNHIGAFNVVNLADITRSLGLTPPTGVDFYIGALANRKRPGPRRISIIMETIDPPSIGFHFSVMRSIVTTAQHHNYEAAVHEVSMASFTDDMQRILRGFDPDAVVFVRISPPEGSLNHMVKRGVPAVLVHADRRNYHAPILANILPLFDPIKADLAKWVAAMKLSRQQHCGKVVIVAMEPESPDSLRYERLKLIKDALKDLKPRVDYVPGYGFEHARDVYERSKNREAAAFVCFSDTLAVALAQMFRASRPKTPPVFIGFDNTRYGETAGISSFDQHRDEIGRLVVEELRGWFQRARQGPVPWPAAAAWRFVDVHLEIRGGR